MYNRVDHSAVGTIQCDAISSVKSIQLCTRDTLCKQLSHGLKTHLRKMMVTTIITINLPQYPKRTSYLCSYDDINSNAIEDFSKMKGTVADSALQVDGLFAACAKATTEGRIS